MTQYKLLESENGNFDSKFIQIANKIGENKKLPLKIGRILRNKKPLFFQHQETKTIKFLKKNKKPQGPSIKDVSPRRDGGG